MTDNTIYHSQRLTASAALALPSQGMYLDRVRVWGGTTPGSFQLSIDGAAVAHFPSPTDGTRGFAEYKVTHKFGGTSVPASSVVFNGGLAVVELIYADKAGGHPPLSAFRGLRFARTDGGAVTGDVTASFEGGDSIPKSVVVYTSASRCRIRFPATGSLEETVEGVIAPLRVDPSPAPALPATGDLTLSIETDGASTAQAIVYY